MWKAHIGLREVDYDMIKFAVKQECSSTVLNYALRVVLGEYGSTIKKVKWGMVGACVMLILSNIGILFWKKEDSSVDEEKMRLKDHDGNQ